MNNEEEIKNTDPYCLAVDVEAFGAHWQHITTQLGAAVINMNTFEIVSTFNSYINPGVDYNRETMLEKRCFDQFWDSTEKLRDQFNETEEKIKTAPHRFEVMRNFITWANTICNGHKTKIVTDTSGFDIGRINMLFSLFEENDTPSMNYVFKDSSGVPIYNGIEQVNSFAKGIATRVPKIPSEDTYEHAYRALGKEHPVFPVLHDHNPSNDAIVIGLHYAYLCAYTK